MDSITLRDWNDAGQPAGYYQLTFRGFLEVAEMDPPDWCIHYVDEDVGYAMWVIRTPNSLLFSRAAIVETFGGIAAANEKIRGADGNIWLALLDDSLT